MINYLSIDFESWVYPDLPEFKSLTSEEKKRLDGGYVEESTEKILKLLAKHKTKLTFFVLAEIYDWYPKIIEEIAKEDHEIAYHTYAHDILDSQKTLITALKKSQKFLKKFNPQGFRAPKIIIKKEYFPILNKYNFKYDSSIYGPYSSQGIIAGLSELPVSSFAHLPLGSGYFVALLGKNIQWFYQRLNEQGIPVISFVHNWQIIRPQNTTFPNLSYILKHPQYWPYTRGIYDTLEYLLQNFSFAPMINLVKKRNLS